MGLGREHDTVTAACGQRLADDLLRLPAGIDVRRIDEVDPRVQRPVDDPDRLVVVGITQEPNIIAPRQSLLTLTPVVPSTRISMAQA